MTTRRLSEVLRGLVSLLALGVLVIGPPVGLVVFVGWPLPTSIPTLDELTNALQLGIDDIAVVKTLAILAWLAWAQVAISIATETAAALRGRAANRLPILPGIQASVGRLVASVALISSTTLSGAHFPAAASTAVGAEPISLVNPDLVPSTGTPIRQHSPATPPPAPPRQAPTRHATVTVEPHDSYWAIAERLLSDGLRWHEIRDLNVGRTMPDGTVIDASSDRLIPGWVLLVPDDARTSTTRPAPRTPVPTTRTGSPLPPEVVVGPGDSMWRLAENHLAGTLGRPPTDQEVSTYCDSFIAANRSRLADPNDPGLIYSGQRFLLPDTSTRPSGRPQPPPPQVGPDAPALPTTSAPAVPDPPAPPSNATTTTPASTVDVTTSATHPSEPPAARPPSVTPETPGQPPHGTSAPAVAATAIASTVLAVGLTWAVRRRRRQRNHLEPTRAPAPPADESFHRQVIAAADEDGLHTLMAALADLARLLTTTGQACRPRIVQHGPDQIDIYLDNPTTPAPEGWATQANGEIWTVSTRDVPPDGHVPWMSSAPLLVTLGRPDDDGQLYLDLETAGLTTLVGDQRARLDLLRAIATEIAHSPLAEATPVYVIGDLGSAALFGECEQIVVSDTWDSVIASLAARVAHSREALASGAHPNPFIARGGRDPVDDSMLPLLVVAAEPPDSPEALAFLTETPAAAAAVVASDLPLPGSTIVECAPDELRLPQYRLVCSPQALDEERADKIAELLHTASESASIQLQLALDAESGDNGAEEFHPDPPTPYEDAQYDILVRYLGDITVEGALKRRLVPKELAAISFIALHRSVTIDRVEDALWASPTTDTRRDRLFHHMSACRNALVDDGNLPHAKDGYYTVSPSVGTDLDLFEARVRAASTEPRESIAVELLLGALRLCTGKVFHYQSNDRDSFSWVEGANLQSHWERRVTHLAREVAERCLEQGDTLGAIEACEAGLRALPVDTACTEALMRAHATDGDLPAVRSVYQEHIVALESIHLDQPAESTTDLYERLVARVD